MSETSPTLKELQSGMALIGIEAVVLRTAASQYLIRTASEATLKASVDSGEDTLIDPYASESPGEFFAVLSEGFFEIPDLVAGDYPDLYDLLRRYYRQDPLARLTKATSASSTAAS